MRASRARPDRRISSVWINDVMSSWVVSGRVADRAGSGRLDRQQWLLQMAWVSAGWRSVRQQLRIGQEPFASVDLAGLERFAGDEMLPPQREVQQVPEGRSLSLLREPRDGAPADEVGLGAEAVELAADAIAEGAEAPFVHRHAESLLLAVDDFVGNEAAHGLLQDVFQLAILRLERGRDAERQLHERGI